MASMVLGGINTRVPRIECEHTFRLSLQDKPPQTLIIVKPQTKSCDVLANFSATKNWPNSFLLSSIFRFFVVFEN
jgi:hypothetical protein